MKILICTHSYPPNANGVANVVEQLAKRHISNGHEIHIATGAHKDKQAHYIENKINVHRFKGRKYEEVESAIEAEEYIKFVTNNNWDIIILHSIPSWTTLALLDHIIDIKAKIIVVGHGLPHLDNVRYKNRIERIAKVFKYVAAIVSLSENIEEAKFCKLYDLNNLYIINNGVNLEEWETTYYKDIRKLWNINNKPWFLNISNHTPVKGHDRFISVMELVKKHIPDSRSMIIGNNYPAAKWNIGKYGIKGGCWYKCNIKSFYSNTIIKNNISREDIVSAVKAADITVLTSSFEASPLVILDSMAAGTPWVAFDKGCGCVNEHAGGIVVPSIEEMAKAVIEIYTNKSLYDNLSKAGIARIKECHNWDYIANKYEQLFLEVINK